MSAVQILFGVLLPMVGHRFMLDLAQVTTAPVTERGTSFITTVRDILTLGGLAGSITFGILAAVAAWQWRRILGWVHSWSSDRIHLWNLIPLGTRKRNRAVALLAVVNQGAVDLAAEYPGQSLPGATRGTPGLRERIKRSSRAIRPAKFSPARALRIWRTFFEEFWEPQRAYVTPGCQVFDGSQRFWDDDAVLVVRRWLASSSLKSNAGKIWVSSPGGTGKTTFIHRLFLELIGAFGTNPPLHAPVPLLASATNLKPFTDQIAALKQGADACTVFADVWLKNRGIEVPNYLRESLLARFSEGLKNGEILLFLDGFDELAYMQLGTFPDRLIEQVRCCVVAQRADHNAAPTEKDRSISLESAWDADQVASHIRLRWPAWPEEQAIVSRVVARVINRHDEIERDRRQMASHWLSQARNLDLFLKELEPSDFGHRTGSREQLELPPESELRRRAESQPYLFDRLVARAIRRVADPSAKESEIRNRLFAIAINDPTDPRRRMDARAVELDDATGRCVRALSELLGLSEGEPGVSPDRLYFRHAALREYFIAGRIAWELYDTARSAHPGDELVRFGGDAWASAKLQAVEEWLRRLDLHEDPETAREHRVALVSERLPRRGDRGSQLHPNMLRNLLALLIELELGWDAEGSGPTAARRKRRDIELRDYDMSGLAGDHLDLRSMCIRNCSFDNAQLIAAQLTHARFQSCSFRSANLSRADALGATFDDCDFGSHRDNRTVVEQMVIDEARFAPDIASDVLNRGAVRERSRYANEFGEKFSKKQPAFLGQGLEQLENTAYLPAIEEAVRHWVKTAPAEPIYLVDLMAGGSYERVASLLDRFDGLHILGIDRDPSKQAPRPRFEWECAELGRRGLEGGIELGLDVESSLKDAFPLSKGQAQIIVAKKALHELDYELQPELIRECADSLCSGGRFILFADTPGSASGDVDLVKLKGVHDELESLRDTLSDGSMLVPGRTPELSTEPKTIAAVLEKSDFDGTPLGQIRFANTWTMVKDWANQNRREVQHRYFASVPEILEWARPWFGDPVSVKMNKYRINPLMFNEQGIQRLLKYLNARVGEGADARKAVLDNRSQLSEWISEGESFRVLVEFTRKKLVKDSPIAIALNAQLEEVGLDVIDPALAPLNSGEMAPSFDFTCAVLVFGKS